MLIMFILICAWFILTPITKSKQEPKSVKYYRYNSEGDGKLPVITTIKDVFAKYNVLEADVPQDATILFLDKFDHQNIFPLIRLLDNNKDKYLYTLVSIDYISSKSKLYEMMRNNIDEKTLHEIMPISFLIDDANDVKKLRTYMMEKKDNLIILKKNIQQQKGCKIISNFDDEKELNNYVIAQELLQNPFLIENRKINIRIYLLINVTANNAMSVFMYNDGFMYYTPGEYKANSDCPKTNITTGYIDRSVYDRNPLTINDFRKHIGFIKTRVFNQNLMTCFKKVFRALHKPIIEIESSFPINKCVVMGADVAVDADLGIKLMEINKGPDLRYKDDRDGDVKFNMVRDTFYELGLITADTSKTIKSNFVKLI
jgi:hypothetical protein